MDHNRADSGREHHDTVMSAVTTFLQALVNGLVDGTAIALGAVGLTLSYGVSRFINFAYGEFLTLGAFVAIGVTALGVGLPLATVVAVVVVGVLGVAIAHVFYRPLRSKGAIPLLITSFGVAFIIRTTLRGVVGTRGYTFNLPLTPPLQVGGVFVASLDVLIFVIAVLVMVAIHALLTRTMVGRQLRAISGNRELARIIGIDIDRMIAVTWLLSAGIGALAGVLLAVRLQPFTPEFGWNLLLVVFAATILGGIGRPYGAMLGALILGITMSLGATYLDSAYATGYAFIVLVLTLLVRPEGIVRGEF